MPNYGTHLGTLKKMATPSYRPRSMRKHPCCPSLDILRPPGCRVDGSTQSWYAMVDFRKMIHPVTGASSENVMFLSRSFPIN